MAKIDFNEIYNETNFDTERNINFKKISEGGPRVNIDYDGIAHQFCLIKDPIKRQAACDKLFNLIADKNAEAAAKEAKKITSNATDIQPIPLSEATTPKAVRDAFNYYLNTVEEVYDIDREKIINNPEYIKAWNAYKLALENAEKNREKRYHQRQMKINPDKEMERVETGLGRPKPGRQPDSPLFHSIKNPGWRGRQS